MSHPHTPLHTIIHTLWFLLLIYFLLNLAFVIQSHSINIQTTQHLRHTLYDCHLQTSITNTPSESDRDIQQPFTQKILSRQYCTPPLTDIISPTTTPITCPTNPQAPLPPPPPPHLPLDPTSLLPLTLLGNSSETTKAMTPPPLPNYPHKCAPISPLTNDCGQRATYNVTPILESKAGIKIDTTWDTFSLFSLSRLGMNPKQIGSHRPSTRPTPPTCISPIPNSTKPSLERRSKK